MASAKDQKRLLEDVKSRLDDVQKQTESINSTSSKVLEALRLDWIRQLGQELKNFMRKIVLTNVAIYQAVTEIRSQLPSRLERCLYQEPFLLEDAIGRIAPVHMQFISSWDAFDAVLESRFRNVPGYKMVQEKKYAIQESATKREIRRSQAWDASFLPGQKVVMSMLFDAAATSTTTCPRCQTPSTELQNAEIHWYASNLKSTPKAKRI